jgi:hypothetical protein
MIYTSNISQISQNLPSFRALPIASWGDAHYRINPSKMAGSKPFLIYSAVPLSHGIFSIPFSHK